MPGETLRPELAVSILRAKASELEERFLAAQDQGHTVIRLELNGLLADVALIAGLLADHIERSS